MPGGMSCGKQIGELTVCFQAVHCLEVKHLAREELVMIFLRAGARRKPV